VAPPKATAHAVVLGCRVDALDTRAAVRRIVELASTPGWSSVVTLGTEMVVRAQHDKPFRALINESTLSLCDTVGVLAAARAHGVDIPERVSGVDLIEPLCAALALEGIPVFLLGGKDDTVVRAAAALKQRHPGLIVAGARDGYDSPRDVVALLEEMRASGARVLLVGLGSPRQEHWIATYLPYSGAWVGIGVGGSFDVLAGNVARAPELWRRLNLEWLYRLFKEPSRWRRQLALPVFAWLVFRERVTSRFRRRAA